MPQKRLHEIITNIVWDNYPNNLTQYVTLENPISEENFNRFVRSSGTTILKPWTLFSGITNNVKSTYRLLNGSLLSQVRTTNLFYELLSLDLSDKYIKNGILILEPLRDIDDINLDKNNCYKLNAFLITTKILEEDDRHFQQSRNTFNPMFDGMKSASRVFTTWSSLVDYMTDNVNSVLDLRKNFYSAINRSNITAFTVDKLSKDIVFKYADNILNSKDRTDNLKEFMYMFDIKPVMVYVSVELDMRGIYTGADLQGLNLLEFMGPAWYSEDSEFKLQLRQNELDESDITYTNDTTSEYITDTITISNGEDINTEPSISNTSVNALKFGR